MNPQGLRDTVRAGIEKLDPSLSFHAMAAMRTEEWTDEDREFAALGLAHGVVATLPAIAAGVERIRGFDRIACLHAYADLEELQGLITSDAESLQVDDEPAFQHALGLLEAYSRDLIQGEPLR